MNLEHRHKLSLFGDIPVEALQQDSHISDDADSDQDAGAGRAQLSRKPAQQPMVKHRGIYYVQNQAKVQELLNVQRYQDRWPLIPEEELHASSVQHPAHPDDPHWRWLLHTRRVPVLQPSANSVAGGAPVVPPCAGVGDPNGVAWACWDCICSLCGKNPKQQPLNGLTNDNWIGREKEYVRDASTATHMLSSLARCCHRQIRLGKGSPDVQQKGISGNTIFFAQPTAEIPSMELPPPDDALVDSMHIVFTRSASNLDNAHWATVKREDYLRIVRERKQQCHSFRHVVINEGAAHERLPENGVPAAVLNCVHDVDGADKAPIHLDGPAFKTPEVGKDEGDAGDESDEHSENDHGCNEVVAPQLDLDYMFDNVAETTVAIDPWHEVTPVKSMQSLEAKIAKVQACAYLSLSSRPPFFAVCPSLLC